MVVLTGAGLSAESGLRTFRGARGLCSNFKIEDVSTLEAFPQNPVRIDNFYRLRRCWHK